VNLLSARVVLRPRPLTEVLDLAVPFCLGGRRPLGALVLAVLAPAFALCLGLRAAHWSPRLIWLVAIAAADVLQGVFTVAASELLFVEPAEVRPTAVLIRFARSLPPALASLLLCRLCLALALFLFPLIPVIAVRVLFAREAVLLEGAGPAAALTRSHRLISGHAFNGLGLLVALLIAPAACAVMAELLGDGLVAKVLQLGSPLGDLWRDGVSGYALAGFFLGIPVTAAARFLAYIDLRTRKEGWDVQLRFTALAARAAGSEAA
jgi:hypothetical protein